MKFLMLFLPLFNFGCDFPDVADESLSRWIEFAD